MDNVLSILSALCSLVGTFGGIMITSKLNLYRIEQLEKKVDKHNKIVERTYNLEKRAAVVDEEIKVANHRIDDLEHERK